MAGAAKGKGKGKEERVIFKAPHVMCECGVKSNYGLVPSELGIGIIAAIWLTMMRLVIVVENMKSHFFSFAKTYDLIFHFNRALGNASENLMMVKLGSWMS